MSDNLVTFENLQRYHNQLETKITQELNEKVSASQFRNHTHELANLTVSNDARPTTLADINRLAGFRMCSIDENAMGSIQLNTNNYDMFYLVLAGSVTISILDVPTDASITNNRSTLARHIKVIIKNPSKGITWPDSVVWMNGIEPGTSGNNSVDIVDMFTPNGEVWFANTLKSWTL